MSNRVVTDLIDTAHRAVITDLSFFLSSFFSPSLALLHSSAYLLCNRIKEAEVSKSIVLCFSRTIQKHIAVHSVIPSCRIGRTLALKHCCGCWFKCAAGRMAGHPRRIVLHVNMLRQCALIGLILTYGYPVHFIWIVNHLILEPWVILFFLFLYLF